MSEINPAGTNKVIVAASDQKKSPSTVNKVLNAAASIISALSGIGCARREDDKNIDKSKGEIRNIAPFGMHQDITDGANMQLRELDKEAHK